MNNNRPPILMPEYLSALLDGEAGEFEQKRVLDEIKSNGTDGALSEKLSTYALIGETMRSGDIDHSLVLNSGSAFLAGIHAKIEEEEQYHDVQVVANPANVQSTQSKLWLKPVGGFAVAASIAAIAVLGLQNYLQPSNQIPVAIESSSKKKTMVAQKTQLSGSEMAAATQVSADALLAESNKKVLVKQEYAQADMQTRTLLKRYVDSHMQYAATAAFVPSIRTIAYIDNQ